VHRYSYYLSIQVFLLKVNEMNELIPVVENVINGETVKAVSARDLHKFLDVETQFSIWISRMFEYGFTENIDYIALNQKRLTAQGNSIDYKDYVISLDMAKVIAMIQRSDKGKQIKYKTY